MAAKHESPSRWRHKIPWIAGGAAALVLIVGALVLWRSGVLHMPRREAAATANIATDGVDAETTSPEETMPSEVTPEEAEPLPPPVFSRPEELRGVFLTAGVDYDDSKEAACRTQLDQALNTVTGWGWNTLILPLAERQITAADGFDAPAYLIEQAHARGMYVYLVLDCGVQTKEGRDPTRAEDREAVRTLTGAMAVRYAAADGFLFTGYAYPYGGLPGDAETATGAIREMLTGAVACIRQTSYNAYIGLLAEPVWAHASNRDGGSQTSNVYEELTDGGADTRALVQDGVVDFVMVKDYFSTQNYSASFDTVLKWWAQVCEPAQRPLYIAHAATRAGSSATGWRGQDQLARQVLACREVAACGGSAFDSLAALQKNSASTDAMQQAFAGTLMEEYIARTLTLTSPTARTSETYESTINLRGSADPNFPLTLNGETVELTDHGYFSIDRTLQYGENTFTFANKGIETTYTVRYRVKILQSVSPDHALTMDGGAAITVSAVARRGAEVYATIAGQQVPMHQAALQEQEGSTDSADYVNFSGDYTLPEGIRGEERALGAVTVTGRFAGQTEQMSGGTLTVAALPIPTEPEVKPVELPRLTPIDPAGGGETLASGTILIIKADFAETFSGDTTDDYSRPTNAYLPLGTTDRLAGTAYDAASKNYYYLLGCGRRVYQEDAEEYITNGKLTANTLAASDAEVTARSTALTFKADWRVPFNLQLLPQAYANPAKQDYATERQTTEYIDITFSYTTAVNGTPDVSKSPLFTRAEWRRGENNTYVLRLYLARTAQFYGYAVAWDNDGNLTFTFRHPTSVAGNDAEQPLRGFKVVIDPGHGGNSIGTAGGKLAEKTLTLTYSQLLRDKLEAMGATVVMTRSTDTALSLEERTRIARPSNADLFISVHMNGSTSAAARGCTVHYFSDYSRGVAERVYEQMQGAYTAAGCARRGGWPWSPFYVCRISEMPALLLECGYMTNAADLELLVTPSFQDALTAAVARGVLEYAQSLPKI